MDKLYLTIILLLFSFTAFSQVSDSTLFMQLQKEVEQLKTELKNQKRDFSRQISAANMQITNLQANIKSLSAVSAQIADSLGIQIINTQTNAENQIANVKTRHATILRFGIIGGAILLLLSLALFWFLRKRQNKDKSEIKEILVKEYLKQAEILSEISKNPLIFQNVTNIEPSELDHSLALKVADQVTVMERGISLIDEKTKGLQRLKNAVNNLKDNLHAKGYEMPELLSKAYNQGMNLIIINSIPDENLKSGEEVITRVIKPQVNFNGKMIQAAQVEVSVRIS
jgi:hypothetical protein